MSTTERETMVSMNPDMPAKSAIMNCSSETNTQATSKEGLNGPREGPLLAGRKTDEATMIAKGATKVMSTIQNRGRRIAHRT